MSWHPGIDCGLAAKRSSIVFLREEGTASRLVFGMSGPFVRGKGHRLPRAQRPPFDVRSGYDAAGCD